jgi:uncharacterized protein DUF3800
MITEYELYSDESRRPAGTGTHLLLGGVICTKTGRARLLDKLTRVRSSYGLSKEMKWAKISIAYLEAYRAWVDIFLADPFASFSMLAIDTAASAWSAFSPRRGRRALADDRLASAFYQFLLVTFGPLRDTKRWWVYPDRGLFSRENVLSRVEFLFNRTYKIAFGPKTSRIIRLARSTDSRAADLIQLADVLLGAFACQYLNVTPQARAKADLLRHCIDRTRSVPTTQRGQEKVSVFPWRPPEQFSYARRGLAVTV